MRALPWYCLFVLLVLAPACSSTQKSLPLQDFAKAKGTFHVTVVTNQVDSYGTFPSLKTVNANVVPAREAILALEKKGYQYVEFPDQAKYKILIKLACFSPRDVALARADNAALDTMFPDAFDPFGDGLGGVHFMAADTYIYPVPGRNLPDVCSGRVHIAVWEKTGTGTPELFQGGGFVRDCGFTQGCPYGQCSKNLTESMLKAIDKVF